MKAKDTVMNTSSLMARAIDVEIMKLGGNDQMIEALRSLCEAQAEISFKAGIREVVETFHDDICSMANRFPTAKELTDFINKWQAKLKEWRLNEVTNA